MLLPLVDRKLAGVCRRPLSRRGSRRVVPTAATLEGRTLLSVTIQINYSYDSANFFNTQAKRDLMQQAANTLAGLLNDSLAPIVPAGNDTWSATFNNPSTGAATAISNLIVPADTLIVYVAGRTLTGTTEAGEGGPGGFNASGDDAWLNTVATRGQAGASANPPTDFGPWGGAIAFGSSTNWYFGQTTAGLQSNQTDFYSVALHELMHVIGFGTANSWNTYASGGVFVGPASEAANGGQPVPLDPGLQHWANGTMSGGSPAVMDPVLTDGTRVTYTPLDLAGIKDIGWNVQVAPASTVQFAAAGFSANESAGSAAITVTRTGTTGPASVQYATTDGSAQAGVDYTSTSGTLNFAAGQSSATFTVPLLVNPAAHGDETVALNLNAPAGGTLGTPATSVLTIHDDLPGSLQFSQAAYRASESAGTAVITVVRGVGGTGPVSVQYATTATGTAKPGVDFTPVSGTLNLGNGQLSATFTVPLLNDPAADGNETVGLSLSSPGGGATLGGRSTAFLTLVDPSTPKPAGDFDGEGWTDQALVRPSTAQWFVSPSGGGPWNVPAFGAPNLYDIPVPGDYDGTGHTELAVFRPSTSQWFVVGPTGARLLATFGAPNLYDIPVPGDYDGVGHTEPAVFRPSTSQWIVLGPNGGHVVATFGAPNLFDVPVPGNYDGGTVTEPAVFRPSTAQWFVDSPGGGKLYATFGAPNLYDIPVPGDYGGVGHAEPAVFRPSTSQWIVAGPSGGYYLPSFGAPNLYDVPALGPGASLAALGRIGAGGGQTAFATSSSAPLLVAAPPPAQDNTPPIIPLVDASPAKRNSSAWLAALDDLAGS